MSSETLLMEWQVPFPVGAAERAGVREPWHPAIETPGPFKAHRETCSGRGFRRF